MIAKTQTKQNQSMNNSTFFNESKENIKQIKQTSKQIQEKINQTISQMTAFERSGFYVKASTCKQNIEKLKKELHERRTQEMLLRHKKQKKRLLLNGQKQIKQLMDKFEKKKEDNLAEVQKLKKDLEEKQQLELANARKQLEAQIPTRLKQSSECLNLKRIVQEMVKQKKYTEAHLVQQQIAEMEKKQKEMFEKQRQIKIQNALSIFKNRQKCQKQALLKKIKSSDNEFISEKQAEIQKLKLKHKNLQKQLKGYQQKQLLAHKGQFKSRARLVSSPEKNRSHAFKSL